MIKKMFIFLKIIIFISIVISCENKHNNREIKEFKKKNIVEDTPQIETITYQCDYLGQEPPGDLPELFSPNFISTKEEHSAVMITPEGNEMWFGRMYPPKIWYLEKTNNIWSEIKKAPLNDNYHYLYPFLSPDGNKIYFTSDRPHVPGGQRLPKGKGDVWYIERQAGVWSEPIHMGDKINFGYRHSIGSVSASGNLYFTVRTGSLYNHQTNIYFAEYKNGNYSKPTIIKELDSDQPSHCPFVAPDESYIIYSSFRSGGSGMSDLYISFTDSGGMWTPSQNLGPKINSEAKDEYPYITPDGKYLFFNSNRVSEINRTKIPDGSGNMYWVKADFIEQLRKK